MCAMLQRNPVSFLAICSWLSATMKNSTAFSVPSPSPKVVSCPTFTLNCCLPNPNNPALVERAEEKHLKVCLDCRLRFPLCKLTDAFRTLDDWFVGFLYWGSGIMSLLILCFALTFSLLVLLQTFEHLCVFAQFAFTVLCCSSSFFRLKLPAVCSNASLATYEHDMLPVFICFSRVIFPAKWPVNINTCLLVNCCITCPALTLHALQIPSHQHPQAVPQPSSA